MKLYAVIFDYTETNTYVDEVCEIADDLFLTRDAAEQWATAQLPMFPASAGIVHFNIKEFTLPDNTDPSTIEISSTSESDGAIGFDSDAD